MDRLRIKNSTPIEKVLLIEPLGDRITLRSNVLYELTATDEFGKMEIDLSDQGFIVHGWVKTVAALHANGNKAVEWQLSE